MVKSYWIASKESQEDENESRVRFCAESYPIIEVLESGDGISGTLTYGIEALELNISSTIYQEVEDAFRFLGSLEVRKWSLLSWKSHALEGRR